MAFLQIDFDEWPNHMIKYKKVNGQCTVRNNYSQSLNIDGNFIQIWHGKIINTLFQTIKLTLN